VADSRNNACAGVSCVAAAPRTTHRLPTCWRTARRALAPAVCLLGDARTCRGVRSGVGTAGSWLSNQPTGRELSRRCVHVEHAAWCGRTHHADTACVPVAWGALLVCPCHAVGWRVNMIIHELAASGVLAAALCVSCCPSSTAPHNALCKWHSRGMLACRVFASRRRAHCASHARGARVPEHIVLRPRASDACLPRPVSMRVWRHHHLVCSLASVARARCVV
jgi:hypothetical protein